MVKGDGMAQLQGKMCSHAAYVGQFSWSAVVRFLFIRESMDCR